MIYRYIDKTDSNRVTLFFAGWGMDITPFRDIKSNDSDIIICYDYTTLNNVEDLKCELTQYSEIKVVAWSLGVYAAELVIPQLNVDIVKLVAINGTPIPIDDTYGIKVVNFKGTIENANEQGIALFNRRMCHKRDMLAIYNQNPTQRSANDLKTELEAVYNRFFSNQNSNTVIWSRAIVGERDLIFTTDAQLKYWESINTTISIVDIAHYNNNIFIQELSAW